MRKAYFEKKKIAVLLAAGMFCTAIPDHFVYAEKVQTTPSVTEETAEVKESFGEEEVSLYRLVNKGEVSPFGYQSMVWVDEEGKELEGESSYEQSGQSPYLYARASFPSAYSMVEQQELPAVRNQGQWGTCWAHAVICSMESNMVKKELADISKVDYSERHLAYFAHRRDARLGDGEDSFSEDYGWYGGGNYYQARAALSNGYGAAAESDYPYASYGTMADLSETDRTSSVCQLLDALVLNTPEDVKRAVMDTGAVMCSFYTGDGTISSASERVYHKEKHTTDHAVTIVGWDDNFAKTEFDDNGVQPKKDGAWLCRNSWGDKWGQSGYFWISYEDATLTEFCSFRAESGDYFDHIYSYDGALSLVNISYEQAANVFSTQSAEELRAVSFPAYKNYDYCIRIYAEGEEEMQLPSDGMLVYSQEGSLDYPGYHTVLLDESVPLNSGMKYAVSVEFISKDEEDARSYLEYGTEYSSEAGQSFFHTGNGWVDTKDCGEDYHNVCVKALTNDIHQGNTLQFRQQLQKLADEAEKLNESDYTAETWTNLMTEIQKAREIGQNQNAAERDIIKAILSLKSARENLKLSRIAILDEAAFEAFAESVSLGENYKDQTVYLTSDLDMTGINHTRIGNKKYPFEGTFDGCGYEISHLSYEYPSSYAGLFGYIGESGVVKNVTVTDGDFQFGASYSGSLAGENDGRIQNCLVEGTIVADTDYSAIGGLVGYNVGQIEECCLNGRIEFRNQEDSCYGGGIAGFNYGSILKCITKGEIISESAGGIGGIAGYSSDTSVISMCCNLAEISGSPKTGAKTAGIGVCLYGNTDSCYNYGKILRTSGEVTGAIYCYKNGTLSNCYYLDTSCTKGGYSPAGLAESMTEEDFTSAKTAYYLNTNGGTKANTCQWSQREGLPIWADDENKAVIRVTVSQNSANEQAPSIHGITAGAFYAKGGETVSLQVKAPVEGYLWEVDVAGLTPLSQEENTYVLPDSDAAVMITCQKKCINYDLQYHLNGGEGAESGTYNVESSLVLPVPSKTRAEFLGWYDNEDCLGEPVRNIEPGTTGNKEFWAKWEALGYQIMFPSNSGYEIIALDGYRNGRIQENGSFLFQIVPAKGYDISNLIIKNGETVLTAVEGVYRIDHIISDIDSISIEGIKLENGLYAAKGNSQNESVVLVPISPATGIKLEGDAEFSERITIERNQEICIVTCDKDRQTSDVQVCDFDNLKVMIDIPVLEAGEVVSSSQTAVSAGTLGEGVLPTSGVMTVNGMDLVYRIVWDQKNAIDPTKEESTLEFVGTVIFDSVPEWVVLPEVLTITKKVTVKKQNVEPILKEGDEQISENGRYRVLDAGKKTAVFVEIINKKASKVTVLDEVAINGIPCKVVEIAAGACKDSKKLKNLILGRYVEKIGKKAFFNCKKLKTIQIKGTALKTIQSQALKKTAVQIKIKTKGMKKKQKAALLKKLKKAGAKKVY